MQLYLDSALDADWQEVLPLGLFHGVTTNPSLAAKAGLEYRAIDWTSMARKARDFGLQEFHAQVFGAPESYQGFAERLYEAGDAAGITTVVKIPLSEAGIRAAPAIIAIGRPVLMTACYHAKQMVTAQALGATYIAPYVGRMRDNGIDAMAHLQDMVAISKISATPTRVLAASLRKTSEIVDLMAIGIDAVTVSAAVIRDLVDEPLTVAAVEAFEEAISA